MTGKPAAIAAVGGVWCVLTVKLLRASWEGCEDCDSREKWKGREECEGCEERV